MNSITAHNPMRFRGILALLIILLAVTGCTLTSSDDATIDGPPVVTITAPEAGATYASGATVNLQAGISNAGEDIARIEIVLDGVILQSLNTPNSAGRETFPIGMAITPPALGEHSLVVTAFRADNTASDPASVSFSVVDASSVSIQRSATHTPEPTATSDQPTDTPTEEVPTDEPQPTNTPEPTAIPASPTPSVPMANATGHVNIRRGPGLNFDPPIGAFQAGDSAEILAFNLNETWLKIRRGQTGEGWIFAELVEITGNTTNLPREAGPATPIPIPPTAVPTAVPTSPPAASNNLVPINPFLDPPQPQCGQNFRAGITIRNDGSGNLATGVTRIQIIRVADGQVIRSSGDALVSVNLPPGGTHTVAFDFNVDVYVNEQQRVVFIADVNNQVQETIETDNETGITYTLPACP